MKNICLQMNRKGLLAVIMMLCLAFPALAQNITVQGIVTDSEGEPLPGASVKVQGTAIGVSTDFDGAYRLEVSPKATLVVNYVGFNPQTVEVNGRTTINIVLQESDVLLNEVVAIGYGTVKKSDATGSVAVVKPDEIKAGLSTTTQDLLVGASPGVVVTTDGGNPRGGAAIRIRGGSSLNASNEPLVVIDGVPSYSTDISVNGLNAMQMISPDNIESISILRDASATAIYGSRASNGVILITTKKGQSGKPQINFSANMHVNTARNILNVMNGDEFRDAVTNLVGTEAAIAQLGTANTNWQREVLRTSISHDYNLSVGGTAKFLPYRVSLGFNESNGILRTSKMDRSVVGINLSPKFFGGLLQVNANVKGAYVYNRDADTGAIGSATAFNPTLPVLTSYPTVVEGGFRPGQYNTAYGIYNGYTNVIAGDGQLNSQAALNPVQMLLDRRNVSEAYNSNGNLQIDYALHFLPDLHLNLNLGYEVSKSTSNDITAQNSAMAWRSNYKDGAGTYRDRYELSRNTLLDFYANYKKEVESIKSTFDVTAGYSWQRMDYHGHEATYINTIGYVNTWSGENSIYRDGVYHLIPSYDTVDHLLKTYNNVDVNNWGWNQLNLESFFGRFNYDYNNILLITGTVRADASSRFSKDNRWGIFPAAAVAWKISNMDFFEGARNVVNDLKLRLGWGVTGQQAVGGYYPTYAIYTYSKKPGLYPSPAGDGTWIEPLYPEGYNADLKWEQTTTYNAGIDFGFLKNRITGSVDYYFRETSNLLATTPVAGFSTTNYLQQNIGKLRNYGIEGTINANIIDNRDFKWTSGVNVAWNRNYIKELTAVTAEIPARNTPSGIGSTLQWHMVGETAYTFRVYQQVYDANGDPIPGQYVDQNADGKIDEKDLINYHSPDPKITATWNNTFSFRNWDLGISLRANFGNYVYNGPKYDRTGLDRVDSYGLNNLLRNTYLFPSTDAGLLLSDYFVEDASFVRCDNITLGYTWPKILNNMRLRLFGAVQNPFVITKYTGLDPEVFSGIDSNVYPRPITFSLGLVANF